MSILCAVPSGLPVDDLGDLLPLPRPANAADVRRVEVGDSDEPLIPLPDRLPGKSVYVELGLEGSAEHRLRAGVVARLVQAQAALPAGFGIIVLDGWRSLAFQQVLYDHYAGRTDGLIEGFVSDPSDDRVVAPHTTGGAVDLTLTWQGMPLALGTDFDVFEPEAELLHFEDPGTDPVVRVLRRLLGGVLAGAGFASYPLEWWHWSYGDQWWAAYTGREISVYPQAVG